MAGGFWLVLQFLPPAASVQAQGFSSLWVLMPLPHSRGFQAIFLLVFLDLCWFPAKHSLTAQHQQAHSPSFPPRSPNQEHDRHHGATHCPLHCAAVSAVPKSFTLVQPVVNGSSHLVSGTPKIFQESCDQSRSVQAIGWQSVRTEIS